MLHLFLGYVCSVPRRSPGASSLQSPDVSSLEAKMTGLYNYNDVMEWLTGSLHGQENNEVMKGIVSFEDNFKYFFLLRTPLKVII